MRLKKSERKGRVSYREAGDEEYHEKEGESEVKEEWETKSIKEKNQRTVRTAVTTTHTQI